MGASKRIFDQERVLNFLHENIGTKYTAAVLAKMFGAEPVLMRELLAELLDRNLVSSVSNHNKFFFIPAPEQLSQRMEYLLNRPFKPLVLPKHYGKRIGDD